MGKVVERIVNAERVEDLITVFGSFDENIKRIEDALTVRVVNRGTDLRGEYRGTLTEGDLLWAMKNMCYMDMRQAEARRVMEIARRKDNVPVRVTTSMHELVERASNQNFVPVVDDKDAFIGLITRKAIIRYCREKLFPED